MAAKYWLRKAATEAATGSCDTPAATATPLPPEEPGEVSDEVSDGLGEDDEPSCAGAEPSCAGGVTGAD